MQFTCFILILVMSVFIFKLSNVCETKYLELLRMTSSCEQCSWCYKVIKIRRRSIQGNHTSYRIFNFYIFFLTILWCKYFFFRIQYDNAVICNCSVFIVHFSIVYFHFYFMSLIIIMFINLSLSYLMHNFCCHLKYFIMWNGYPDKTKTMNTECLWSILSCCRRHQTLLHKCI